jgi:hypothetical protein
MSNLLWSKGEKPERSPRFLPKKEETINRCLLQNDEMLSSSFVFQKSNKREDTYNKMSEREMIGQVGYNPFNPNNNYFENLLEHEKFLKNE